MSAQCPLQEGDEDEDADEDISGKIDDSPPEESDGTGVTIVQVEVNDTDPPQTAAEQYLEIAQDVYRRISDAPDQPAGENQEYLYALSSEGHFVPVLVICEDDKLTCAICSSVMSCPERLKCGQDHSFCQHCIGQLLHQQCPVCRSEFSDREEDKERQRRINDLTAFCPECNQSTTLSEIASHLRSCELQPVKCASCQTYIESHRFPSHLQICANSLNIRELDQERLKQLAVQLAKVLQQNTVFDRPPAGGPPIHLPDEGKLYPVRNSPEIYARQGSVYKQEFYIRIDLSDIEGRGNRDNDQINLDIVDTCYESKGRTFTFKVSISFCSFSNSLHFAFFYDKERLKGNWEFCVLDNQGTELTRDVIKDHQVRYSEKQSTFMVYFGIFGWGKKAECYDLFARSSEFWDKPAEERICFFRIRLMEK